MIRSPFDGHTEMPMTDPGLALPDSADSPGPADMSDEARLEILQTFVDQLSPTMTAIAGQGGAQR